MKRMLILVAILSFNALSQSSHAEDFKGYPCTEDCSGHEAGYEWAERNDIDDEFDCGGNSNSCIEGCQAFVEEQEENKRLDDGDRDE